MKASATIDIDGPAEQAWAVISHVENWPVWTPSVRSIRRLDPGPLRVGARHRIKQPRLPTTTWTVTELIEGESFTWTATGPGILTSAQHRIEPTPTGSRAILSIDQKGILGQLLAYLITNLTHRYLSLEATGLKQRAEQLAHRT
jgi:uncharacterized membrane protein